MAPYRLRILVHFLLIFINSQCHVWKIVWILISWFLKEPADLDLHCLQSGFILFLRDYVWLLTN